jgi:hypothetical protein
VIVAGLAGASLGEGAGKLSATLVALYLCGRIYGHAETLVERGTYEGPARWTAIAAPVLFLIPFVQTWGSSYRPHISLSFGSAMPSVEISSWTRVEWSADVLTFTLFLSTAMAVWVIASERASSTLSMVAQAVLAFFTIDLLRAAWGVWRVVPQWRILAALLVLSVSGAVLVATLRRIERLDESPPEPPADPPAAETPEPPAPPAGPPLQDIFG